MAYKRAAPRAGTLSDGALIRTLPAHLELAAAVLCKRWKPAILWLLLDGRLRFGELGRQLPIVSAKVLTQQLRELERDGLVRREAIDAGARQVTYALTEMGRKLADVLADLQAWGAAYHRLYPAAMAQHGLAELAARIPAGGRPASPAPLADAGEPFELPLSK